MMVDRLIKKIKKGDRITILKSYWYNGEGWYKTKEFGDIPDVFEITYDLKINQGKTKMNKKIKEYLKKKGLRKNQKIDGYFMGVDFIKVKTSYKNCSNLVTIRMSSGNIVDVRNLGTRGQCGHNGMFRIL